MGLVPRPPANTGCDVCKDGVELWPVSVNGVQYPNHCWCCSRLWNSAQVPRIVDDSTVAGMHDERLGLEDDN